MPIAIAANAACEVLKTENDVPGASRMTPPPNGLLAANALPIARPNKGGGGKRGVPCCMAQVTVLEIVVRGRRRNVAALLLTWTRLVCLCLAAQRSCATILILLR
jgi:hypothetical protein